MSMLKKFSVVGAVVSFLRSPAGQRAIIKATDVVMDPRNRARAAEFATKMRRRSQPGA